MATKKNAAAPVVTSVSVPAAVFAHFLKLDKNDKVDLAATGAAFAAQVETWYSAQAKMRPAIEEAVKAFGNSVAPVSSVAVFVCAKLELPPTNDNQEMIKGVIDQMVDAGKLVRATDEKGAPMRGRGAGVTLAKQAAAA